jgi:hypothetical protein
MDTLKILLGATVALLLGALAVSYKNLGTPPKAAAQSEQAELLRQIEEVRLEQDRLQMEKQRMMLQQAAAPAPTPVDNAAAIATAAAEREVMQRQIAELQKEKEKAERDAEVADREAAFVGGKMLEGRDQEARRARMIRDSLVIGRIKEWVEDPQFGGFATVEVIMPDNVQPGTVLCIRRNTGILGRLRVGEMSIEGAIANPVGTFPEARPQAGDELILEPPF